MLQNVLDECVCVFQRTLLSLSLSGETPCIPCLQRVVAISLSCDSVIRLYLLKKATFPLEAVASCANTPLGAHVGRFDATARATAIDTGAIMDARRAHPSADNAGEHQFMATASAVHVAVTRELHTVVASCVCCERKLSPKLSVALRWVHTFPSKKVQYSLAVLRERNGLPNVDEAVEKKGGTHVSRIAWNGRGGHGVE